MTDVIKWLDEDPPSYEIAKNNDGSEFIPIAIVEELLNKLTDRTWETKHFAWSLFSHGDVVLVSASVQLEVGYTLGPSTPHCVFRSITGAVTFTSDAYAPNINLAATALSECIKNAAKKLGRRFGNKLNDRGAVAEVSQLVPKPYMDVVTAKKYENARKAGDVKTQLEIENHYNVTA